MPPSEESIRAAIAREEAKIGRLEGELEDPAPRRPSSLSPLQLIPAMPAPVTSAEKVALFRSRFRGRDDIYPRFWTNARTGRKGYAAFVETCRRVDLPAAVERSRSGNGRSRLVFLLNAGGGCDGPQDGLLSHHRDDDPAPPAEHGVIRPALSQPGHPSARWIRQSHRPPTPARPAANGQYGLRR
jgi:hypothetical protein